MSGVRGLDTVPMMLGKGEAVLDHSLTARLEKFLAVAPQGGSSVTLQPSVTINAGMMLGTEQDAQKMSSSIIRRTGDFTLSHIVNSTLQG